MSKNKIGICPACGVKIVAGDKVLFSFGPPGTRSRLWARVCQFAKKPGCINQDKEAIGEINKLDYYGDPDELPLPEGKELPEPLPAVVSGMMGSKGK
ncbi:hypothetical protein [Oscillatoria salina]|uniref:hypothetical protein n=1 Tax=Oscillatoria salina TaxID=331517 RepID=UPI001CCDC51B|nr:hypothetical protein [Oscillatoria salina]